MHDIYQQVEHGQLVWLVGLTYELINHVAISSRASFAVLPQRFLEVVLVPRVSPRRYLKGSRKG